MYSKPVAESVPSGIFSGKSFDPGSAHPPPERLLSRPSGTLSSIQNGGEGWGEEAFSRSAASGGQPPPVPQNWTELSNNAPLLRLKPVGRVTGTHRSATGTPGHVIGIAGAATQTFGASTRTPGRLAGTPFTLA